MTKSFETDKRKSIDKDAENCTMALKSGKKVQFGKFFGSQKQKRTKQHDDLCGT